eukprot:1157449-Pelagomonas_calceolata.AAC.5
MDSMSLSSITEVHGHSTWMLGVQNRQSMHWPSSWHAPILSSASLLGWVLLPATSPISST